AIKNVGVCMLTKSKLDQIMSENPDIAFKILTTVTKRLAHTENLVQNLATKNPEIRIINMILEFCDEYGCDSEEGILIHLPLTREEMASYIGVKRETISRKLNLLEDTGIIATKGNRQLIVRDKEQLQKYIQ